MLKSLKKLWTEANGQPEAGRRAHTLELCVAVLMVEIMRADGNIEEVERRQVLEQLQSGFDLSEQATENLLDQAGLVAGKALDMHQFTSRIVKGFSTEERIGILQRLWSVAMADDVIDPYEDQLVRRMADLLGIHHRQFIGAKLAASAGKK